MTWALLILAILLEVGGTTLLKLSNGFAQPLYAAGALLLYGICFYLLAIVMQHIPMGIALIVAGTCVIHLFSRMRA